MADLTGVGYVQQRAAYGVIADLSRSLALVGHVAIRAGYSAAGVDALAPHLELGMLRLEHLRAAGRMFPIEKPLAVGEFVIVVISLHLLDFEPVVPG